MYLARVIGRLVATQRYEGLSPVAFQLIQPVDEDGADIGDSQVAAVQTSHISSGPGDFVTVVDGREAALVLPETYVPIDVAIIGIVEQVARLGESIRPKAESTGGAA